MSIWKKKFKLYFQNISRDGIITNKNFRAKRNLFLQIKVISTSMKLLLNGNKTIIEGRELSETFEERYINIAELHQGKKQPMLLVITTFLIMTKE